MTAHAGGWAWRKHDAGRIRRPWAWSEINGSPDLPQHVGGLCEKGWHDDCPQAPLPDPGEPGTCGCDCHAQITGQMTIDDAIGEELSTDVRTS